MMRAGVLCLLAVAWPLAAAAQVNGPLVARGDLEAGLVWHWVDRELAREGVSKEFAQSWGAVAFRYGLTGGATFAVELSAVHSAFDSEKGLVYSVGGGLQTGVWSRGDLTVTTTISYAQLLLYGGTERDPKYWEQVLEWRLTGEYRLRFGDQDLILWAGPSLSDFLVQYREATTTANWDSSEMLGAAFGARVDLLEHLILQADFTWVGDLQSNVLVAWRF